MAIWYFYRTQIRGRWSAGLWRRQTLRTLWVVISRSWWTLTMDGPSFPKKWSEANTCQADLDTRYLILLHKKSCPDPPPWHSNLLCVCACLFLEIIIYLFLTPTQMYHGLRTLAHSLHFKYQWMQLLALEYSKGLFECVQASCMLPFVRVTGLCGVTWMEISVCACLRRRRRCPGGGKEKWQNRETDRWSEKEVEST